MGASSRSLLLRHHLPLFARSEAGVSALEYAILVGVIAVVLAGALTLFSADINEGMNEAIGGRIKAITPPALDLDG